VTFQAQTCKVRFYRACRRWRVPERRFARRNLGPGGCGV